MSQYQFRDIRKEKLDAEKTAFRNCREDFSDVSFEIGKSSYTAKAFGAIVLFAVFFGGRIILRRRVGNPEAGTSAVDIGFWVLIAVILVVAVASALMQRVRAGISVSGKTVFCGGNCFTSDEISKVRITRWMERVEIYADGKRVIKFPWELDNSELFIAWARRCGITIEDRRPAHDWRGN